MMKTTNINLSEVKEENPFYTAKWEDVSPDEQKEVMTIISQVEKSRKVM